MDEYIAKKEALRVIADVFFETAPDGTDQLAVLKCSRLVREIPAAEVIGQDRALGILSTILPLTNPGSEAESAVLSCMSLVRARPSADTPSRDLLTLDLLSLLPDRPIWLRADFTRFGIPGITVHKVIPSNFNLNSATKKITLTFDMLDSEKDHE